MNPIDRNGLSRISDASVLAERLQVDRGTVPCTLEDPHAELKTKIHRTCIARLGSAFLNLEGTRRARAARSRDRRRGAERRGLTAQPRAIAPSSSAQIAADILGYGPLEPFLQDPSVTEVMVNGYDQLYIERAGRIEETDATFVDDAHLLRIIDRIVSQVGRRIDESSPMVDARLPDGSRVNAIIPPLALARPDLDDPEVRPQCAHARRPRRARDARRAVGRLPRPVRAREAQHADLGRYRNRVRRHS